MSERERETVRKKAGEKKLKKRVGREEERF